MVSPKSIHPQIRQQNLPISCCKIAADTDKPWEEDEIAEVHDLEVRGGGETSLFHPTAVNTADGGICSSAGGTAVALTVICLPTTVLYVPNLVLAVLYVP